MTFEKPSRKELLSCCDAPGPDDGVDPRKAPREPSAKVPNRKALQLCGQVARTLNAVLQGECRDDVLRDLMVESVVPAPTSVRLLVTVGLVPGADAREPARILEHLQRAQGLLRLAVSADIHRRKAPDLIFRVAGYRDTKE